MGEIAGPLLGNWLYDSYGWYDTCDYIGLAMVIYAVIYFVFCWVLGKKNINRVRSALSIFEEPDKALHLDDFELETEEQAKELDALMAVEMKHEILEYIKLFDRSRSKTDWNVHRKRPEEEDLTK